MTPEQILKVSIQTIERIRRLAHTFEPEQALRVLAILEDHDRGVVLAAKDLRDKEIEQLRIENRVLRKNITILEHDLRVLKANPQAHAKRHALSRLEKNRLKRRPYR